MKNTEAITPAQRAEIFRLEDEALDNPSPEASAALTAYQAEVYGWTPESLAAEERMIARAEARLS
jgi:hypothetical protein